MPSAAIDPEPCDDLELEPPSRRRRLARVAQAGLGLGLGLLVAEAAFWIRDDGAFPHVNFYEPDPELGARLRPGSSMRFRLGDNPTTKIHVNAQGFRGADWPEVDEPNTIMVLGDSQVFGLGVEDEETFAARLAERTGRPVLNAGVPTYGPPEYLALAEALLTERDVDTVVYVINYLNDPFELARPNVERHAIWDGWAVRIETAPAPGELVEFPGRRWLMSRSHLIYAARRFWHSRDAEAWIARSDAGLPSEGDWEDLLGSAEKNRAAEASRAAELEAHTQERSNTVARLDDVRGARDELAALERELAKMRPPPPKDMSEYEAEVMRARPGDIVHVSYVEGQRSVYTTGSSLNKALKRKRLAEAEERRRQAAYRTRRAELEAERDRLRDAAELDADELAELEARLAELDAVESAPRVAASPFEPHLRELAALCERHGAELLVVALPFDVQVSSEEWAKYGVVDGPDMRPTRALLDDLVDDAQGLGIAAINASYALVDAEPGAFLDGDIHMTPKGHAALAEAIAKGLRNLDYLARN